MFARYGSLCRALFLMIMPLAAASCAPTEYRIPPSRLDSLPVRAEIADVPFHPQEFQQCGPAALAMVLNWSGSHVTPEEISHEIYTPGRKGTLQPLLVSAAREHNRLPFVIDDFLSLLQEIAAGHPVLVLQNLALSWYPRWHYAVVIGYDSQEELVILRSGDIFRKQSPWKVFLRTWDRADHWGMLALPLTDLPASADEQSYLEAVLPLETIGRWEEAATAYQTALERWPKGVGAHMGLGNSRYAMGNLEKAEEAFRRAAELCPACGDAFNNLAHVLAAQGRYEEAEDAAREALRLGGPNEAVYRETMEEIKEKSEHRTQ
jgi:tetratricopeptide (TPR) repeat protein